MSLHQRFLWTRSLAIVVGLGVLALLLWAPRSQAATVSQTLTGSASGPLALTFDHFDASLGDLESVTVELSASATGQPSITLSCGDLPCTRFAFFGMGQTLQPFTQGTIELSGTDTDSTSISCLALSGRTNVCAASLSTSLSRFDQALDAPTLDLFDDPGTFTLSVSLSRVGGSFAVDQSATATVTYTYSERVANVSEPAGWLLALPALLGLAPRLRRPR